MITDESADGFNSLVMPTRPVSRMFACMSLCFVQVPTPSCLGRVYSFCVGSSVHIKRWVQFPAKVRAAQYKLGFS